MFSSLKPKSVKKTHSEHIQDVINDFKAFCLPKFLQKDDTDIYKKMFHEKVSEQMKKQLINVTANLQGIH